MDPVEIGLALALLGALAVATSLALLLHTARRANRPLEENVDAMRSRIRLLEDRALDTVTLEGRKSVTRHAGESLDAFGRRTDLEAMKGRDSILSAVLASGHITEKIDINDAANTAHILHTLKVAK